MQADYRNHSLFMDAEARTRAWLRPGTNHAADLMQIQASPDGKKAAAAALVCEVMEGGPSTRIAVIDIVSGDLEVVTHGPRSDSQPKWSPDGRTIAFLSDRDQAYVNSLRLLDLERGMDRAPAAVDGFVEYAHWSADGCSILIGVAGFGSDLAGAQGAFSVERKTGEPAPAWAPAVEGAPEAGAWRALWLYDLASDSVRRVSPKGVNIWEASWCGPDKVVAVCSEKPDEAAWYTADVRLIGLNGEARVLFTPKDQLGWLAANPSGDTVAVVEAVCSDRIIVAGDVRLIDVASGKVSSPATLNADVVKLFWRGDDRLLFAAGKGPETLIGVLDTRQGAASEIWRGKERSSGGMMFPEITPLGCRAGDGLFMREGFFEAPVLVALQEGRERELRRFGVQELDAQVNGMGQARDFAWKAPDGQQIHGWLLQPQGKGPHPLIMFVHGGPIGYVRPRYIGRSAQVQMLLAAGYAIFQPNPRGSSGRGQAFAREVLGDMGGADTRDYLSGLDALQAKGIVDPKRIGVTGASYGGFMASWLITQDQRFAAAVPVAPITNWVSEHLTCNVPHFCEMFLDDDLDNPTGQYFTRSPIHYAGRVKTPSLNICGGLDHITPAGQALEFHRALLRAGVESVLVTYPQEGHGVRNMPAVFDYTARLIDWFQTHMPAAANA